MGERFRSRLVAALGIPFTEGNHLDVLRNGEEIFPAMLEAIRAAEATVDFLTFVYWRGDIAGEFAETLADAARRGVKVRVLLDGVGALPVKRVLLEQIRAAGGRVEWFRPLKAWRLPWKIPFRTHRKILVCDDVVAFTGGVGVGEQWEGDAEGPGSRRETHFRVRGPAVDALRAAFLEDWLEAVDEVEPPRPTRARGQAGELAVQVIRSSGGLDWSDRATLLWTLAATARQSIRISTPYFVPSDATTTQLARSARRGVAVSVLIPGPYLDWRAARFAGSPHYGPLLDAGVEIYEYQPTLIHQKVSVFDGAVVSTGSANLNQRSRLQDHEVELVIADPGFGRRIEAMLDEDFGQAVRLRPETWRRRGPLRRVAEFVTAPLRRQM